MKKINIIVLTMFLVLTVNLIGCSFANEDLDDTYPSITDTNTSATADGENDIITISLRSDKEFEGLASGLPLAQVKDFDPQGDYSWLERDDLPDRSFHETSDGHYAVITYKDGTIKGVSTSEYAESAYKSPKENKYIFSDELNRIDEQYSTAQISAQTLQLSRTEYYDTLVICRDEWKGLVEKYTNLILASEDQFALPHRELDGSVYLKTFTQSCSQWELYAQEKIAMYEQLYLTLYDTGSIVPNLIVEVECEVYRDRAIELYLICRDAHISTELTA